MVLIHHLLLTSVRRNPAVNEQVGFYSPFYQRLSEIQEERDRQWNNSKVVSLLCLGSGSQTRKWTVVGHEPPTDCTEAIMASARLYTRLRRQCITIYQSNTEYYGMQMPPI